MDPGSPAASPLSALARAGGVAFPALEAARAHTAARCDAARAALAGMPRDPDVAVVLLGSWGRGELTSGSDDDVLVVTMGGRRAGLRPAVEELAPAFPGGASGLQGTFDDVVTVAELATIGLQEDSNRVLTRRMLVLLESAPLLGPDVHRAVLAQLLANHTEAGGRALLLSATLGAAARTRLLTPGAEPPSLEDALATPYPALAGSDAAPRQASSEGTRTKTVRLEVDGIIAHATAIAERAVAAARAGASVLVVRNSVAGAVAVAQAVEALAPELAFRVEGVATLHHGRFAPSDRRRLDTAVERAFGKERTAQGRILVGTQTLEQSLDIDADLLLTDLAPIDVLLQRIGRLHRHDRHDRGAFAEARAVVLRPAERDLTRLLTTPAHGLGPMRDGRGVYPNLLGMEATLRVIERVGTATIPADNRLLVEHALHPEVLDALAAELGTDWRNHAAASAGVAFADAQTGRTLALDLSQPFRDLHFPDMTETVATRLGAADLLVDFAQPLPGPFGRKVERLPIPHWMAHGIGEDDLPKVLPADGDEARFGLGSRTYRYGRWGLRPD